MISILLAIGLLLPSSKSFQHARHPFKRSHHLTLQTAPPATNELLDLLQQPPNESPPNDSRIQTLITHLETTYRHPPATSPTRFRPLIGNYNVSHVRSLLPGDNPVGGKWTRSNGIAQRLLRTRRTLQHILPVNATGIGATVNENGGEVVGEAVNVIALEALFGIVRCTVVLRGDAVALTEEERGNTTRVVQPLSSQAVKALFDSPRIILGRKGRVFNVNIGPSSLVLLDTNYCDEKMRIGMGGTSGTRFVFVRCADGDEGAVEYMELLRRKPAKKAKALLVLGAIASTGAYGAVAKGARFIGGTVCILSVLFGALIATASGGIESNDRGVRFREEENSIDKS